MWSAASSAVLRGWGKAVCRACASDGSAPPPKRDEDCLSAGSHGARDRAGKKEDEVAEYAGEQTEGVRVKDVEQAARALGVRFDERGLVPAVVQQSGSGEVLMLAWMNAKALALTLRTKTSWFWSRSRRELWNKGATSGNVQQVLRVLYDCDADTILLVVDSPGPACHTGHRSCFYREIELDAPTGAKGEE